MITVVLNWLTGSWWRAAALVAVVGLALAVVAGWRVLDLRAELAESRADAIALNASLTLAKTRITLLAADAAALRRAVSGLHGQLTAAQAQARTDAARAAVRRKIMSAAKTGPIEVKQLEVIDDATSSAVVDHLNAALSELR